MKAVGVQASVDAALTGVRVVSAGRRSACAVMESGAVRCWGSNDAGQLGDGTRTASTFPVTVSGIDGTAASAVSVSVGDGFACAVLQDASVRCWGRNSSGQLGNGTTTSSNVPIVVLTSAGTELKAVSSVAAGAKHVCATADVGGAPRVACWGANTAGQLGDGTTKTRMYATLLGASLVGVRAVSAGGSHTVALVPDSARVPTHAVAWGANNLRQLGLATSTPNRRTTPVAIPAL